MIVDQDIVCSSDHTPTSSPKLSPPNSPLQNLWNKLVSPNKNSPKQNKCKQPYCDDNVIIQRIFNYFDENGDGKISTPELQSCVRTVSGEVLTEEEAEIAVQSTDSDDDGLLDLEDFSRLIKSGNGGGADEEVELKAAFGMYAAEGRGCITPKSLKRMLSRLGEPSSVGNCEVMIKKFDINGDGVLNFDEFKTMMKMH